MNRRYAFPLLIALSLAAACENRARTDASVSATPPVQQVPTDRTVPVDSAIVPGSVEPSTFMTALSETILGLVQDMRIHPERDAIDTYAAAFQWKPTTPGMNALLNVKKGYAGKLDGKIVLLGSDGTNEIVGLTVREGFEPAALVAAMRKVLNLELVASDISMGQKMEVYELSDNDVTLGFLSLTYGVAESIQGAGTVGFMSKRTAKAEGLGG